MKRNENKVPGFDEIVFRNRNKTYGAYDLRKRYKSAASFSVLSVSSLAILLLILLSTLMPKDAIGGQTGIIDVIYTPTNLPDPNIYKPPDVPKPPEGIKPPAYVPPVIVDDTTVKKYEGLQTADWADKNVNNGDVTVDVNPIPEDLTGGDPIMKNDEPLFVSQEQPEFPGGPEALNKFIIDNLKYPQEAADINLQGKVIVKFAINADGSVSRLEVLRSVNPLLDQEAKRVVSIFPKWRPGKQNGVPVAVWFVLPVTFRLSN